MSSAPAGELVASGEERAARYPVPFWFRWVLARRSPWWIAAGVACAYLPISVLCFNLAGVYAGLRIQETLFLLHPWGSLEIGYALYFAWVPVAIWYLVRGAERDLADAAPLLGLSGTALEDARARLLSVPARALCLGSGAGLCLALLTLGIAQTSSSLMRTPGTLLWSMGRETLIDVLIFCVVAWGVVVAARLSQLARVRAGVRLLDPHAFAPFVQNGARLALLWLVMWSIQTPWMLFLPVESFVGDRMIPTMMPVFVVGAVLTAIAVALPTRGVRDRIRAAKREELERVRHAVDDARDAVLAGAPSAEAAARLPGLLAYERRIQDVNEWPLDAPILRRLGLYLLIPLASWIGGALVEHVVDIALE